MLKLNAILVALLISLVSVNVFAKTTYLDKDWNPTTKEKAKFYQATPEKLKSEPGWKERVYFAKNNQLYFEGKTIQAEINSTAIGPYKYYYDNGQIQGTGARDSQGKAHGEIKVFTRDGKLIKLFHFYHGKLTGVGKEFYPRSGKLYSIEHYKNDKLNGEAKYYHQNGQLSALIHFIDGKRHGEVKQYNDKNQLVAILNYQNGKYQGENKTFYNNGKRRSITFYRHGQREGTWKFYAPDGHLTAKSTYHKNIKRSEQYFKADGTLLRERKYNQRKQKIYSAHYSDGKNDYQTQTWSFDAKGHATGQVKRTYTQGKLAQLLNIDSGKNSTLHERYDSQGNLTYHEKKINGHLDGRYFSSEYIQYANNLKLIIEAFYQDGQHEGNYKKTISDGSLAIIGQYHQDKKVGAWSVKKGNSLKKQHYDNHGQLDGTQKEFYQDQLIKLAHFSHGQQIGLYEEFQNGQIITKGHYRSGKRNGPWQLQKEHTENILTGNYNNGVAVGQWQEHSKEGYLLGSGQYNREGKQQGKVYQFNRQGMLIKLLQFKDGKRDGKQLIFNDKEHKLIPSFYDNGTLTTAP
ncbi:hypothetical protein [Celerinatantimonas sp. MCCC 1A17872]|uniref:toxin-antitoxin system YwqK family antitoxin n=1 Tax=Celerinatantimonas sp. MCCC 1A17872 TaxID=3177514 RepID=UPI0038C3C5B9